MCNKRKFYTKFEADKVADKMSFKYSNLYKTYVCFECNCFHIAHRVSKHKVSQMIKENYKRI
jgi:hypothetical protein